MSEITVPSKRSTKVKIGALLTAGVLTATATANRIPKQEGSAAQDPVPNEILSDVPPVPEAPTNTTVPDTIPEPSMTTTIPEKRPPTPEEYPDYRQSDEPPSPGPGSGVNEVPPSATTMPVSTVPSMPPVPDRTHTIPEQYIEIPTE